MIENITFEILLPYIFWGVLIGVVYNIYNYVLKNEPGAYEIKRAFSTILFGIVVGIIAAIMIITQEIDTTNLDWWSFIVVISATYYGGLAIINKFVDALWVYLFGAKMGGKAWFYDVWTNPSVPELTDSELKLTAPYYRKMNEDRLHNMVFDQPVYLQQPIRDCVIDAEAKTTWRYAIQAGAWEYLIEYGVQTGGKHYWFYKSPKVAWKPISVDTLENIRKTGKWPDYSVLT